eukprot:UN11609
MHVVLEGSMNLEATRSNFHNFTSSPYAAEIMTMECFGKNRAMCVCFFYEQHFTALVL